MQEILVDSLLFCPNQIAWCSWKEVRSSPPAWSLEKQEGVNIQKTKTSNCANHLKAHIDSLMLWWHFL